MRSGRPSSPPSRENIEELWSLDVCSKIQPGSSHMEEGGSHVKKSLLDGWIEAIPLAVRE
jgi:hypothetical protein